MPLRAAPLYRFALVDADELSLKTGATGLSAAGGGGGGGGVDFCTGGIEGFEKKHIYLLFSFF